MDLTTESHLRWIVIEGLNAPVPLPWKAVPQVEGEMYYFLIMARTLISDYYLIWTYVL
jgi:hypothetical protein